MLRLSNLADYAVVACTALARSDVPVSAARLAEETGIAAPTMAKLAGILTRAGLLSATRGAYGGVALARSADAISLAGIVEAVDGPIGLTACSHAEGEECRLHETCRVRPHWQIINDRIRDALGEVTLADLAQEAASTVQVKEPA